MDRIKKYLPELLFIAGMFFIYILWATAIPYNHAPDEKMKWDLISYIFHTGTYPAGYNPAIIDYHYGNSYAFEPALVYIAEAVVVRGWSLFSADPGSYCLAARVFSAVLSCGTIFVLFRIGKVLFTSKTAWLFAAGIALLPQYAFLSSYINNDIFGIFCTSLIIYFCICGIKSKWAWRDCFGLSVGIGFCLLSYYYAYPVILASVFFFLATSLLFARRDKLTDSSYAKKTLTIAGIAVAIAGWYFVRNIILYNGDVFALNASGIAAEKYAVYYMKPSVRATPEHMGYTLGYMLFNLGWIKYSFLSAFGVFGHMRLFMPAWTYAVYYAILGFGCAAGFRVKKWLHAPGEWKIFCGAMLAAAAGICIMSIRFSYADDFQPQGRYLLQAVIPVMLLFCVGIEQTAPWFQKKAHFPLQFALIGLMGVFLVIACFTVLAG